MSEEKDTIITDNSNIDLEQAARLMEIATRGKSEEEIDSLISNIRQGLFNVDETQLATDDELKKLSDELKSGSISISDMAAKLNDNPNLSNEEIKEDNPELENIKFMETVMDRLTKFPVIDFKQDMLIDNAILLDCHMIKRDDETSKLDINFKKLDDEYTFDIVVEVTKDKDGTLSLSIKQTPEKSPLSYVTMAVDVATEQLLDLVEGKNEDKEFISDLDQYLDEVKKKINLNSMDGDIECISNMKN